MNHKLVNGIILRQKVLPEHDNLGVRVSDFDNHSDAGHYFWEAILILNPLIRRTYILHTHPLVYTSSAVVLPIRQMKDLHSDCTYVKHIRWINWLYSDAHI